MSGQHGNFCAVHATSACNDQYLFWDHSSISIKELPPPQHTALRCLMDTLLAVSVGSTWGMGLDSQVLTWPPVQCHTASADKAFSSESF